MTRRSTGRVVCGDRVTVRESFPGEAVVERILPRRNVLERTNYRGQAKPLAANLDLLFVVIAPAPIPDLHLLDAYLVLASHLAVKPVIVLNKVDTLTDTHPLHADLALYRELGYGMISVSAKQAVGLDAVGETLDGGTAILLGQSGVGKSSLVNRLIPDIDARTQALSATSGQGRHTTTETTLYHVPPTGALIDSPGIRILRLGHLPASEIQRGFPEVAEHAQGCDYRDCRHDREPACAVRAALESGQIAASRLVSFHRLLAGSAQAPGG
nr:ribosome small subunit-dependent GTPase A [Natronocella acetinitrilica]